MITFYLLLYAGMIPLAFAVLIIVIDDDRLMTDWKKEALLFSICWPWFFCMIGLSMTCWFWNRVERFR